MNLRLATRGSALARYQANAVAERLRAGHPGLQVEVQVIRTRGDAVLDRPISDVGGKAVFVKELEDALLNDRADFAVHSLKDVPAELPPGLAIVATPCRADPRDALILPRAADRAAPAGPLPLEPGARVGCCSLRRRAQLLAVRPDLEIRDVRGNVDTRLRKLDAGEFDALILAAAGLIRLGEEERIDLRLPVELCLPAPTQGILGLEARADDEKVIELLQAIDDPQVHACAAAERAVLATLGGDCDVPLGALAALRDERLEVRGRLLSPDGGKAVFALEVGERGEAVELGRRLGSHLLQQGGREILAGLRGEEPPA